MVILLIQFTTGDLLQSEADALVNTVNCEGYMGKGIAYQFKLKFPQNNLDYVKACKSGYLTPGKLHYFRENGKIVINFPTKNKWREKSKIEYITNGLDALIKLISDLQITSIAIPPLGSGNGGLIWSDVKAILLNKLEVISKSIDIFIYEPSKGYQSLPVQEPKLNLSALVLMEIKENLDKFDHLRLQKTAYFMNLFAHQEYFKFEAHKFGPYAHSIEVISRSIREFQKYYGTHSTEEAKDILYNKLISDSVETKLNSLLPYIIKACTFVNNIESDHELECLSTICFLVEKSNAPSAQDIVDGFQSWTIDKARRFPEEEIIQGLNKLVSLDIITDNLFGYTITI